MRKNRFVVILLMLFVIVSGVSAQRSRQQPSPPPPPNPFDGRINGFSAEQLERIAERDSVMAEQEALGNEAKPMIDEQDALTEKAKPFIQIKKSILERDKNLSIRDATHKNNCHAGELEPGPYKACLSEHAALDQEANNIKIDFDYNENNLRPILTRYDELEDKLQPYLKAYKDLDIKRQAIEREVIRLHYLIEGLEKCKTATNCPPGGCSQKQLEFVRLCEDIKWGNADPKLLLVDPTLAAEDPNLPPSGWRPPRFSINANGKP